jgi:dTDP-4-dehydrorhamnose reductase
MADVTDFGLPLARGDRSIPPQKILVVGANGQVGRAVRAEYGEDPWIEYTTRATFDITAPGLETARPWQEYGAIINAAAYTAVDAAETPEGRTEAWLANVTAVAALARVATAHGITLVHVSSDYVFDGSRAGRYVETDPMSPLGVYGQTKAAGDAIVQTVPRHYIIRTSWVIGDGKNFVRAMASLAGRGIDPAVVDDQVGRLSFAPTLATAIRHLLETAADYGVYNVTSSGEPTTWYEVARAVFACAGHDPDRVTPVTTEAYFAGAAGPIAPRPRNSVLDTGRILATGMAVGDGSTELASYLAR